MSNNKQIQQGWECPKCGGVYSPYTNKCNLCPQSIVSGTSTTSTGLTHFCTSFEPSFNPSPTVGNTTNVPCKKCGQSFWQHIKTTNGK